MWTGISFVARGQKEVGFKNTCVHMDWTLVPALKSSSVCWLGDCASLIYSVTTSRSTPAAHKRTKCDAVSPPRFPARAVSVLQSGCLESLLLRSLYTDREFWESRGGVRGITPLIRAVEQRGKILLQRVREKKMQLKSDLWMSRRHGRNNGDAVDSSRRPATAQPERSSAQGDAHGLAYYRGLFSLRVCTSHRHTNAKWNKAAGSGVHGAAWGSGLRGFALTPNQL